MITYRRAKPGEWQAYTEFANMVFSLGGTPHDFAALLPKVYAPGRLTEKLQYLAVDENDSVRGLVAALPTALTVGDTTIQTAYIGTVSTHPEARRQGHMVELMNRQLAELKADGCELVMLGGQRQRYQNFGFVTGGERYLYEISRSCIRHCFEKLEISDCTFEELRSGSEGEQWADALMRRQLCWYDRSDAGYAVTCRSFRASAWLIRVNGALCGTLVAAADRLRIDELFLTDESLLPKVLKAWQLRHDGRELRLVQPAWMAQRVRWLNSWAEGVHYTWNNNVSILNFRPVLQAFLRLKSTYGRLTDGQVSFCVDGESFTVRVSNGVPSVEEGVEAPVTLTHLEACRLFLSPFDRPDTVQVPSDWFPLPVYCGVADEF